MLRHRLNPPKDLFPVDPWAIETTQFTGEYVQQAETVFALANGYLGLRGSHEEDHPIGEAGTYLNGFYELRPIIYGETAYGFPQVGQTMLNCLDGKIVKLYVDDEPFDVEKAEIDSYSRRLDMQKGTLVRDIVWSMPGGKRIRIRSTRFVSIANRHLAAMQLEITPLGSDANLTVWSRLVNHQALPEASSDPRLGQGLESGALVPVGRWSDDYRSVFSFKTRRSGLTLGCGMDHAIETESPYTVDTQVGDDFAAVEFKVQAHADEPVRISKFLAYHYSDVRPPEEMLAQTAWTLDKAMEVGFPALLSTHEMAVADFWERSDVVIDGAPETQQIVRWNLFQLMQASACVDGLEFDAQPELWSPETPCLYDVTLSFGRDFIADQVGFREIRVQGRDILLNGRPLWLRGICYHEDDAALGKCTDEADIRRRLGHARELGANCIRLAHYPHHEDVARLADEKGMLLFEEIPVYWAIDFANPDTCADAENQLRELIRRDANRASVIFWGVGNENADTDARFAFMRGLAETARAADPTRLVTAACLVNRERFCIEDRVADTLDVIGLNEYFGWYEPDFADLERLLANSDPDRPVMVTECGADAVTGRTGAPGKLFSEAHQAHVLETQLKTVLKAPYMRGFFPWLLYDFRTERRQTTYQRGYNLKGLIDRDKTRKKAAFGALGRLYEELARSTD